MTLVVGGGDGKSSEIRPAEKKVILENNYFLLTNEESGFIWKSYIVGEKSCTASKRERVSQELHIHFTDSGFCYVMSTPDVPGLTSIVEYSDLEVCVSSSFLSYKHIHLR